MASLQRNVCLREQRRGKLIRDHLLQPDVPYYIYSTGDSLAVDSSTNRLRTSLGCHARIVRGRSSVEIRTVDGPCYVCAPLVHDDPHEEFEELQQGKSKELRQNDEIRFGNNGVTLTVTVGEEEVLVNSSAPPEVDQNEYKAEHEENGETQYGTFHALPDAETTLVSRSLARNSAHGTPAPSLGRIEKVEDTPAINGRTKMILLSNALESVSGDRDLGLEVYSTANEGLVSQADSETPVRRRRTGTRRATLAIEDTELEENADERFGREDHCVNDDNDSSPGDHQTEEARGEEAESARDTFAKEEDIVEALPDSQETTDSRLSSVPSLSKKRAAEEEPNEAARPVKKRGRPPKATPQSSPAIVQPTPSIRTEASMQAEEAPNTRHELVSHSDASMENDTPALSASQRSTRSFATRIPPNTYSGEPPRVVYSNSAVAGKLNIKKFLSSQNVTEITDPHKADFDVLCVGKSELKKTGKLLLSIALGKQIVTDDWVLESLKAKRLLALKDFLPRDPPREKEWRFKMDDAVGKPRNELLQNLSVYFTPALKKEYGAGFREIEDIVKRCGASRIIAKPARDLKDSVRDDPNTICLASEHGDLDAATLMENKTTCYHKDLISISILRGYLALDDEKLVIRGSNDAVPKSTRKSKRS